MGSEEGLLFPFFADMAKSKNHTANNQSYKAHRNGIHKPKPLKGKKKVTLPDRGNDPKFLRNLKFVRRKRDKLRRKRKRRDQVAKAEARKAGNKNWQAVKFQRGPKVKNPRPKKIKLNKQNQLTYYINI